MIFQNHHQQNHLPNPSSSSSSPPTSTTDHQQPLTANQSTNQQHQATNTTVNTNSTSATQRPTTILAQPNTNNNNSSKLHSYNYTLKANISSNNNNHHIHNNNTHSNITTDNNTMQTNQQQPSSTTAPGHQQLQQQQLQQQPGVKRQGYLPNPIVSERCWTFKITPEERRHRDFEAEQSKILKEIMQKTNTKIEVTTTKDGALNFCIIGKEQNLKAAKSFVLNDFQTNVTLTVNVPKSIHGRLLGPKGARLASIQDETQTKIAIPRKEEGSDTIKIVGIKSNAELAVRSIQKYVREFAGKTVEKVTIEKSYLLFVTGPYNENLKRWEELGAKVSSSSGLLPSNSERESGHTNDEVTFTIMGESTVVSQIKEEILAIYEDKKKKCTTVAMEVKKAQHKYILGPGGQNLRNFFAKTNVSVELPHENDSETITLRGERSKIAPALSELYLQAHSETDEFVEVESWFHKYLIGPRKTNLIDFKARGVEVKSLEDKIKLHGPPTEVEDVRDALEAEIEQIKRTIVRKDIRVEPRIHGYIIGKSGATVDQIREESGAYILVPKNDESSDNITLEGTAEAVAIAEEKIDAIAKKYEASRKLVIDQQLHGSIIGRGGEKIRSIREKFSQVVFTFPEQGSKNNEITILGPANEVEECYQYLDEFHKQLQESNHQVQVPIKQEVINYLPDAQSAIKRIKLDNHVKIDLFIDKEGTSSKQKQANNNNKSNNINNINANNKSSESPQETTANNEVTSTTNKKSSGAKNKQDKTSSNNKDNTSNSNQNNKNNKQQQQTNGVAVTSTKEAKGKATAASNTAEKGSKPDSTSPSYAIIIGKKEDVDEAKVKFVKLLDELATTSEFEVKITPKLRSLLGPKTKAYRQLLDEFQQKVVISFPPPQRQERQQARTNSNAGQEENSKQQSAAESNGISVSNTGKKQSENNKQQFEIVKIRGPKNIAKKAAKNFETLATELQEKVDKNYQLSTTVETTLIDKIMSTDKLKLNKIREAHSVKLMIPDKRDTSHANCFVVGYEKNVQAAMEEFKTLVKDVEERMEETIEIPSQFHPRLIGAGGRNVKKIMEEFKVGVKFARQGDANPDSVILIGNLNAVTAAKDHMLKQANQYRV